MSHPVISTTRKTALLPDLPPRLQQFHGARSSQSKLLVLLLRVLLPPFVIYVGLAAFVFEDYVNMGVAKILRATPYVIGKLSYVEFSLGFIIGAAFLLDRTFRQVLSSRGCLISFAVIGFYTMLGLVLGNAPGWIRSDFTVWGSLLAGIAVFRLMVLSKMPRAHLVLIGLMMAAILYLGARTTQSLVSNEAYLQNERVWDFTIFHYCDILLPLIGLLAALVAFKNVHYFLATLVIVAAYFYCGVIVGATRTLAVSLMIVLFLSAFSMPFRRDNQLIYASLRPSGLFLMGCCLFGAALVVLTSLGMAFTGSSVIAERLAGGGSVQDYNSILERFEELADALDQLGFTKLLVGGGIGWVFDSFFGYESYWLHLGTFTFLLKFGVLPFLAIVAFLYLLLPLKFLLALARPRSMNPCLRTGLLVAVPGVLGWLFTLTVSGGYTPHSWLTLGITLGIFLEIRRNGLVNI